MMEISLWVDTDSLIILVRLGGIVPQTAIQESGRRIRIANGDVTQVCRSHRIGKNRPVARKTHGQDASVASFEHHTFRVVSQESAVRHVHFAVGKDWADDETVLQVDFFRTLHRADDQTILQEDMFRNQVSS